MGDLDAADFDDQSDTGIVDRAKKSGDSVAPVAGRRGELVFRNCDFGKGAAGITVGVHLRLHDGGTARVVPVMQDAAAESTRLADLLRTGRDGHADFSPRATAEVWTALWRISELPRGDGAGRRHPFVAAAQAYVEEHLAGPLSVPEVARAVGISHTEVKLTTDGPRLIEVNGRLGGFQYGLSHMGGGVRFWLW
ncbi:hypothetical protein [Streptomyces jeddahensis]|uniref:ATP-grasp domain-containing protein n=1 Tax=Streptomyces jeddahensis TaxID=1716141 RepID=A0A177HYR0_9ACTN|nr:hypothetical protein [Streptomyces jeddahensis]OAH15983.1 hypothetical protein STSP_06350 [Streptomyces jeddahensis]